MEQMVYSLQYDFEGTLIILGLALVCFILSRGSAFQTGKIKITTKKEQQ